MATHRRRPQADAERHERRCHDADEPTEAHLETNDGARARPFRNALRFRSSDAEPSFRNPVSVKSLASTRRRPRVLVPRGFSAGTRSEVMDQPVANARCRGTKHLG